MKSYPMLTPYQFAANKPINGIDLDGLEWVLKIYSPENSTKFLEATNSDDIYRQREITYYSLQRDFPDNYAPKVTIGEVSPKAAELFYDESARRGLTVTTYSGVYDKQGELVRAYPNAQKQFYDPDDQAVNYDHSWPVDIRATSAWEERFGKEYVGPDGEDVDLKLFSFGVELYGPNNSKGTQIFSGRLKGFGPVSLTVGTVASNGLGLDINIMGGYFGKFNGSGEAPLLNAINGLNGTFDFNSNGFSSENWTIFGGSVGAPIPLPKMFEGAQKLFEKTEGKAQFEVTNPKK